jgi:hypothetical protein
MFENDIRDICRKIIESLIIKLNVNVEEDVRERLVEGLINSIRAITFLAMMKANSAPERSFTKPSRINLSGTWFSVKQLDIERVMQYDLPVRHLREEIRPTLDSIQLALDLETNYGLSKYVKEIILEKDFEKALSVNSIAFEAEVLNKLKKRVNKRERSITMSDFIKFEEDSGKWFG